MSMSATTLKNELISLIPTTDETSAINRLADGYATFASDAQALTPITTAGVALGKEAMIIALSGINTENQGAQKIVNGIIAFWNAVAFGLTISFSGALAITPPPNASLLADLTTAFSENTLFNRNLNEAVATISDIIYANAIIGGTVTTAGTPLVITPIL